MVKVENPTINHFVGQTPVYRHNMSVESYFEKWIVDFLQQIEDVPQTDNGFPPTCKHSKWSSPYSCPKLGRFRTQNRADLGVSAKLGTVYRQNAYIVQWGQG
jgi:hypothetical protein